MKGMTLDFAVTRVFELESKKEFIVNRMITIDTQNSPYVKWLLIAGLK